MKLLDKPQFFGDTNVGMIRTENEDTFIATKLEDSDEILCAAIDGLGGYEGGEVAADIARRTIIDYMNNVKVGQPLERLKNALTEANNAIVNHKNSDPMRNQMGCVVSAGLFNAAQSRLWMAHIGDSRLYQFRDGKLEKLSHDHSLVGYREEIGELSEAEAMAHPRRNVIERSLGDKIHSASDPHFLDAGVFPIEGDTLYLFCSDGLSDMLTSAEITKELSRNCDLPTKVSNLIQAANNKGGKDNITVVLAHFNYKVNQLTIETGTVNETKKCKRHGLKAAAMIATGVIAGGAAGYFWGTSSRPSTQQYTVATDSIANLNEQNSALLQTISTLTDSITKLNAPTEEENEIKE